MQPQKEKSGLSLPIKINTVGKLRRHHERSKAEGGRLTGLCPVEGALKPRQLPGQSTNRPGGKWTVRMEGSRIVFPALEKRSSEIWMQSEPCCPRIIMGTPLRKQSSERSVPTSERRAVKRAPNIAIPSCGPSRLACRPQAFLAFSRAQGIGFPGPARVQPM